MKTSPWQSAGWGAFRPSRMRLKTWLGACRVMQLMDSKTGVALVASLAQARATAWTVRVLPASGAHP